MAPGLSATGFTSRTTADILTDLNSQVSAALSSPGNPLNISAASAIGQLNGIMAAQLSQLWDLAQAVYAAYDPDQATGDALAALALITGTVKRGATYSVANAVTVNLNAGTTLPAGSLASVAGNPQSTFASLAAVTNSGGSAANFTVGFQATAAGPVLAPAGTLTVISTPVSGWNSVTNSTDAIPGLPVETDPALRTRRISEIQAGGSTDVDAIQAALLQTLGTAKGGDLLAATVLGNDTNATDANGLPPHAIEVIALGVTMNGAANTALAAQIYALKAAGDQATGTSSLSVLDSQGNSHLIGFTRPTVVPIYVSATVLTNPVTRPVDAAAQIQTAIVNYGLTLGNASGQAVIYGKVEAAIFTLPWVVDVTALTIGTAPSPTGTVNVPIALRQVAQVTSSNVLVTVSP